jgi:hypothetical protein
MLDGCQLLAACVRPIAPRVRLIARERWRWIAQVPSTSQGAAEFVAQPGLSLKGKTLSVEIYAPLVASWVTIRCSRWQRLLRQPIDPGGSDVEIVR